MLVLLAVPALSAAATGLVTNGDFETAGQSPTDVPGWTDDHCDQRAAASVAGLELAPRCTMALDAIGVDNSRGLLVIGPEVRRSAQLFAVTAGSNLTFSFDVQQILSSEDATNLNAAEEFGSVAAIEFVAANGTSMYQLTVECSDWLHGHDPADTAQPGGATEFCGTTGQQGYHHIVVPDNTTGTANTIPKYANPIVVPAGAVYGRVLLGGSLLDSEVDPLFFGAGLETPLSLTTFDNVDIEVTP